MFSMYRLMILSFLFVVVLANLSKEDCRNYLYRDYLLFCCKNEFPANRVPVLDDAVPECDSMEPMSCERSLCITKKLGLTTEDDKLDKAKAVDVLFANLVNNPSLMEDVKSKCIDGDVDIFAPAESCDFLKLSRCISMQWLKRCSEWDDNSECEVFKLGAQECANLLS